MPLTVDGVRVEGNAVVTGSISPTRPRSEQATVADCVFPQSLNDFFISDTGAKLPTAATGTQLAHIPGTYGTSCPQLQAGDLKAAGSTTRRARKTIAIPLEFPTGGAVKIRVAAGMVTTIANTSCTVLVEAYKIDRTTGNVTGANLTSGVAVTMNSLTISDKTFDVTATSLSAGDHLDVRVSVVCNDGASATAVIPTITAVDLLCTTQG